MADAPAPPARPGALDGLRVVEVAEGIPGAYAAKLLGDHGAEVVKVERPAGDPLRRWSAATPDEPTAQTSALFHLLAGGRRSVTTADAARVERVVGWADVVLVGDDAPVDPATIAAHRRPDASVVRITPYGDDGPLADHPADELLLQAWSGLLSGCGTPTTPPLQMGIGHGRWATGAVAGLAALAAHRHASRTGAGVDVEVTGLEVMAVCLNNYPALYRQFTGNVSYMSRSGDWPQITRCKDGWIGLCIFTAQQWADFAAMIGRPELAADERLNSMGGRARNRAFAESVVRPWLEEHTAAEIHELGGLFRIPVAFVGNGAAVLDMEHFLARGSFVDHPAGFRQPRSPFRMGATAVQGPRPAPEVGADDGAADLVAPAGARIGVAARAGATTSRRPLDGVTVVDLTAFWAGPAATHLLATLGADVVKVESPKRPDGMRFATVKPPTEPDWMEYGPTFHGTNPAKRSVTIDFAVPEGREVLLRLVEQADVVVENFTPRVMANAGLDWDDLRARNPALVMLRMPAFGLDGPWRDHSGFAQTMEQTTGIAWLTGTPEVEPLVRSTIDPIAGIHGAFAVLAALEHRDRTGEGQLVELPMCEVALNVAAEPIVTYSAYGLRLDRSGNRGPTAAPQGAYRCAGDDAWLVVSVHTDAQWAALVEVLGAPDWTTDPALATRAGRRARHDEIDAGIAAWTADREPGPAVDELVAAGVPAAVVWPQMVQDELPQLAERGFTQWLDHPIAGRVGLPGTGIRSPQLDLAYRAPAPTVGQHTHAVLTGLLGLGDDELAALAEAGAIGPVDR